MTTKIEPSSAPPPPMAGRRRRGGSSSSCTTPGTVPLAAALFCALAASLPGVVRAALPTASLDVYESSGAGSVTPHLSEAYFGPILPMGPRLHSRPDPSRSSTVHMGLALSPSDDELLCNEADGLVNYTALNGGEPLVYNGQAVLVPRGGCTFQRKVLSAQRLGASGAVVYNNLANRYKLLKSNYTNVTTGEELRNATYDDILWPRPKHDYDCNYARAWVPKNAFNFDPLPYDAEVNDPLLTGSALDGNLCAVHNEEEDGADAFSSPSSRCPSQRCFLTGREDSSEREGEGEGTTTMEACCAWDIHMGMSGDSSLARAGAEDVEIPSLFATMAQGSELLGALEENGAKRPVVGLPLTLDNGEGQWSGNGTSAGFSLASSSSATSGSTLGFGSAAAAIPAEDSGVSVSMYLRWHPHPNASSFLLWMLGTFVTWIASYLSAADYRKVKKRASAAVREGRLVFRRGGSNGGGNDDGTVASEDDVEDDEVSVMDAEEEADVESGPAAALAATAPEFPTPTDAASVPPAEDKITGQDSVDPKGGDKRGAGAAAAAAAAPPMAAAEAATRAEESGFEDETVQDESVAAAGGAGVQTTGPAAPPPAVPTADDERRREDEREEQPRQSAGARSDAASATRPPPPPETLELNMYHVAAFIVFASAALFVLFFFKIYTVVRVLYGLGCSGAMAQVVFVPCYIYVARGMDWLRMRTGAGVGVEGDKYRAENGLKSSICPNVTKCGWCGEFTYLEVVSVLSGYAVGISWIYVSFADVDPASNTFYWIAQDVMGSSICVAFLSLIRLNSIKIATILLVAAFVYDIFFVFITPYIFDGDSIMITVATSGGPPDADPDYCEKYPSETECQGGDPLPMLLTVPRINDYRGGSNLLGLGDIVLPGLLLSFGARLDGAAELYEFCTSAAAATAVGTAIPDGRPSSSIPGRIVRSLSPHSIKSLLTRTYLAPLTVAYAIGLLMANVAVFLMKKGQPALLYLVPACLGTMLVAGKLRGELKDLWKGPPVLRKADRLEGQLRWVRGRGGGGGGGNGATGTSPAAGATGVADDGAGTAPAPGVEMSRR
mmetsp:Transcript_39867/g.119980  ORF Transcript_39867/g.119980 Transcript_39867/m.119980 type:complete len:1066 (-) Transcript_39867:213-3410(-)